MSNDQLKRIAEIIIIFSDWLARGLGFTIGVIFALRIFEAIQ